MYVLQTYPLVMWDKAQYNKCLNIQTNGYNILKSTFFLKYYQLKDLVTSLIREALIACQLN